MVDVLHRVATFSHVSKDKVYIMGVLGTVHILHKQYLNLPGPPPPPMSANVIFGATPPPLPMSAMSSFEKFPP